MKNRLILLVIIITKCIFSQDIKASYKVIYKRQLNPFSFVSNKYLRVPYLKIKYENTSDKNYYFLNSYTSEVPSFLLDWDTSQEPYRIAERKFDKQVHKDGKIRDVYNVDYLRQATDKNWHDIVKKIIKGSLNKRYNIIINGLTFSFKRETYDNLYPYVALSDIMEKQQLLSQYKTGKKLKYLNGKGDIIKISDFGRYISSEIFQKDYWNSSLDHLYDQAKRYFIFLKPHESKSVSISLLSLYLLCNTPQNLDHRLS